MKNKTSFNEAADEAVADYVQIFELVSPVGCDEEFIGKVLKKAKAETTAENKTVSFPGENQQQRITVHYSSSSKSSRPVYAMYALSAALVALVVLSTLVINLFGRFGEPLSGINPGSVDENADIGNAQEDSFNYDPGNPYSFTVQANTFEGLEVSIADMRGDENTIKLKLELAVDGRYFVDVDEFVNEYPALGFSVQSMFFSERQAERLSQSGLPQFDYSFYGVSNQTQIFVENGAAYCEIIASGSGSDAGLQGLEFEIMFYSANAEKTYDQYRGVVPNTADDFFAATFTANYEPIPSVAFWVNEEIPVVRSHGRGIDVLEEIKISDISIQIVGLGTDCDYVFVIDGVAVPGYVMGDEGLFVGSSGSTTTDWGSQEPEYRGVFSGIFRDGFDKNSIDAIIINGVEIKLVKLEETND